MPLNAKLQPIPLDDLYKMVAQIYSGQNIARSPSTTFGHFVEVCGMLTMHDRKKRQDGSLTVTDALCKALGWYFPLMAKMRVKSVEELIYRKYPYACPYCGLAPHRDGVCKLVWGTGQTLDHDRLRRLYLDHRGRRPSGLDDWQQMFQEIYPRQVADQGRSVIGLFEEVGEFAEAIRVSEKHPMYFLGEAADIFSYLMGIANEHSLRLLQEGGIEFSFEVEFLKRYPGLCMQCGSRSCVCPAIPEATVGRMAKELDIGTGESRFLSDPEAFAREGQVVAHHVLERVGGYEGLTLGSFPFDRGDASRALMTLCLKVAAAVESGQPSLADNLRAEALKMATSQAQPGSPSRQLDTRALLQQLSDSWRELDEPSRSEIKLSDELVSELGDVLDKIRVLFVTCSPSDEDRLRVDMEQRAVLEAVKTGESEGKILLKTLPAATVDDLRRALLVNSFDIVHFSGHGDTDWLLFETAEGKSSPAPLSAVADLIGRHPSIRCVLLNACQSVRTLSEPISPLTVGMDSSITDDAAIEFTRGFYEALAAGHPIRFAIKEGIGAVELKGLNADPIRVIPADPH
jgi:NTP pyrophosphatase (non-canonical NTP hydrolase)